jgi:hypothetical protein
MEHLQKIVCQSYTVALGMVEILAFAPACFRKHCVALLHEFLTVVAAERQRFQKIKQNKRSAKRFETKVIVYLNCQMQSS